MDLLEAPTEVTAKGTLPPLSPATEIVRFEHVSFAYPAREGLVLDALDLELRPGETLALVGETGVGKSTVASLLLGLAEPTAGRVTVGGVDLARFDLDAWRRELAWVPQRPTIFHGTVSDNIRLARAEASDEEIRAAARLAGADGFVRALPDGYDTVVGEAGGPCPRASGAGSRSRARSSGPPRWSSSTNRPRISTGRARCSSPRPSSSYAVAPSSCSRIRRSSRREPIASSSSTAAEPSSSSERTAA